MSDLISKEQAIKAMQESEFGFTFEVDVAIEAVKTLPTVEPEGIWEMSENLISRKEMIRAVDSLGEDYISYYKLLLLIGKMPSAEPRQKWTPVSEALPKPWQEVLTTYEYKGKRFVQTAEYAGQNDENGHPLFCAYSDEFAPHHYDFVYVAWMPLVEPWRGE